MADEPFVDDQEEGMTPLFDDDWAPGRPQDWADAPTTIYQVVAGRVFSSTRWRDGSTARGEVELVVLEDLLGGPVTKEGFYEADGTYIGPIYTDLDAWERGGKEPTLDE